MRGRIRTIKPEAFTDEDLWDLEVETGLPIFRAFTGLWCYADREGRFEWRPRPLKAAVLPYWDGDVAAVLDALERGGFIRRYVVDGVTYGFIPGFLKHQAVGAREAKSVLPPPPSDEPPTRSTEATEDAQDLPDSNPESSVMPHVHARACTVTPVGNGKGREWEGNGKGNGKGITRTAPPDHFDPNRDRKPGEPPRPRSDIAARPLQPAQWQPSDHGLAYAAELGLSPPEVEQTLVELRDKHGLRPHDVGWWDTKWARFVEQTAKSKTRPRNHGSADDDPERLESGRRGLALLYGKPVQAKVGT